MRKAYQDTLWLGLVALALLAIYLPALSNPPIFDDRLLSSGELFNQYGVLSELKPRLLSYGSFIWLQELFGQGWWKHRLVNLLIHGGVILALWGFYRQLTAVVATPANDDGTPGQPYRESPALGLAIGVFALNPVAVYAVAYLIQRSILMATLFVVLALWSFARGLATGQSRWFPLAVVAYLLAVLSKEHAIMAPLAAVPVYILVARPSPRRLLVLALGGSLLVAAVGAMLAIRYGEIIGKPFDEYSRIYVAQLSGLGRDIEHHAYPLSIFNQAYLFFKYGFHWFAPLSSWMSIDLRPPFPITFWSIPQLAGVAGYIAVLVGGMWLVIRYRDGRALLGLSLLMPATLFITEFSTVWIQDPFVLYRSYLWAIGVPGIVLLLFHGLSGRVLLVTGVILGAGFVWQGMDRGFSMSTPEALWSDAINKLPNDPLAVGRWFPYVNRAEIYLDQGRLNEAYRDFKASSLLGDHGLGAYNIAAMFGMTGKYPESLKMLDEAGRQGYDGFGLEYQRGVALYGLGKYTEARQSFAAALKKQYPVYMGGRIYMAMGRAARAAGDHAAALTDFRKASELAPQDPEIAYEFGALHLTAHRYDQALAQFDSALAQSPSAPVYHARAIAHYQLNRKAAALADIEAALRLKPDEPAMRQWREKIRAMP